MKKCIICDNEYPATLFYFNKNLQRPDGLTSRCIKCLDNRFKGLTDEIPLRLGSAANLTEIEVEKIEKVLFSIQEKSKMPYQKTWHEIKQGMPTLKGIEF